MIPVVPSDDTKKFLKEVTTRYSQQLRGTHAEHYLMEERGFTRKTLEDFLVGYVVEPELGHDTYSGCIVFPYLTRTGVVSIRFRSVPPAPKAYFNLGGDGNRLYNAKILATNARKIAICEGEPDTITATQCGIQAVGCPGATSWNPIWNRAFRFREIIVLADGDDPGEKFAKQLVKQIENSRYVILADGEDVNSFVKRQSPRRLRERLGIDG